MNLDDKPITFPCPTCGKEVRIRLGEARRNGHVTCACGQGIALDGNKLNTFIEKLAHPSPNFRPDRR
jgi:hypothetical protein